MVLSRKKLPIYMYIAIVLFCTIAMLTYTFPESLDITGYYEKAQLEAASGLPLKEYLLLTIAKYVDFIYHTILFLSVRNGIPLNLVSIIILSTYYITILEIIRKHFAGVKFETSVLFYSVLACPFAWVQEIPRTLTAIIFLYIAVEIVNSEKKKWSLLFLVLAFFSHAGASTIFIICLALGYFLKRVSIGKTVQIVVLIVTLLVAFVAPGNITVFAMGQVGGLENHYAVYSDIEIAGLFSYSAIGYGDRISAIMIFAYSIYLVLISKKNHIMYWFFYSLCVANSFFIVTNYSLFNRTCMLLPLFIAYNAIDIYNDKTNKGRNGLLLLSYIGVGVVFLEFYFYRGIYSF